jgi:Ca-activated chloride channel homolog
MWGGVRANPVTGASEMRFTTYSKYKGSWMDALNLESLMEFMSDFLMDGGFSGGPNYHPFWGWSGVEDTSSVDSLQYALLRALMESGGLTQEMLEELRGEGQGDEEVRRQLAEMLDRLIERMVEEGYITLEDGQPVMPGQVQDATGTGEVDEAKAAAQSVQFDLTQKGMDFLGYRALRQLLGAIGKSSVGSHETPHLATGIEADAVSKPYEFGDTLNLDIPATLKNAIERNGLHIPLELDYKDLMVHQAEYRSSCATVLLLDISHSMVLYGEDRFSPAKRVALALSHLIRHQFPGDVLKVVTFGDRAQEIPLSQLARAQVGPFHTNTAEALLVARNLLRAQKKDMQQIIMITDGKPSAVTMSDGQIYTNSGGMDRHILSRTFHEVAACRKAGILINTFMLARDPYLVEFVEKVSKIARGKAYFTSTLTLGQYIMKDFLRGKGRRVG